MLRDQMRWLRISERLADEVIQCRYEGKEIENVMPVVNQALAMDEGEEKEEVCKKVFEVLESSPVRSEYRYKEPESYDEIQAALQEGAAEKEYKAELTRDALKGAWYGRAAGCLLGIPVETWTREQIKGFLKESGQYPLQDYIRSDVSEEIRKKYNVSETDENRPYDRKNIPWKNCIDSFPVDDDINYPVSALRLIEEYGTGFESNDVLENWLLSMPVLHACTAERIALQNALNLKQAPKTAVYFNPYREWIGAQIRGDFFGYINPGKPHRAAELAYKDAAISHTKNGIYGEIYIAALLSLVKTEMDMLDVCKRAMLQVPPKSRLAEDVNLILELYENGADFKTAVNMVHNKYQEKIWFDWCYVNPNAMIVTACILWFEKEFSEGICQCILCGFDTDCNGATVGSILGMRNGFGSIDKKWAEGLSEELNTSIHRYSKMALQDVVDRTIRIIKQSYPESDQWF